MPATVSVVMPFRDSERFLREAIESVLAQTYEDWELLLVDDGAVDGSTDIATEYAACESRISYLAHTDRRSDGQTASPSRGVAPSRNLGIAHATGEYIAFLDSDDVWLPRTLDFQAAVLMAHPDAAMAYGLSQWWYSWTGDPDDRARDFVHPLGVPAGVVLPPPSLLRPFFVRQEAAIPNPSSVMLRRSAVTVLGGFELDGVYEDQAFYAKVLSRMPVVASEECLDRYRQHEDSSTTRLAGRGGAEAVRAAFLGWLVEYVAENGVGDDRLLSELRRERFRYAHPRLARVAAALGSRG